MKSAKASQEFVFLLLENYGKFRSFLAGRTGDLTVAEDILQHSLAKAIQAPPKTLSEKSILGWFYTILRNSLTDYYRARAMEGRQFQSLPDELSEASLGSGADPLQESVCECLYGLLPAIRKNYAQLIQRIDLEGESPAIVAKELKISRNSLDVRLFRARQALRKALEEMCGACSEHACLRCSCKSLRKGAMPTADKRRLVGIRPPTLGNKKV